VKFLPQNWNDTLSFIFVIGMPALWLTARLPETVLGATISVWTLVAQFYFRQRPPKD